MKFCLNIVWYLKVYTDMRFFNLASTNHMNFYSDEMFVTEEFLIEHYLKLTYQRQSIDNLDSKHKEWSKDFESSSNCF